MNKYLVLTATGRDRPGVVERVTARLLDFDGNIEVSRMARLGGEFALLALVSTPEEQVDDLIGGVGNLSDSGIAAHARRTEPAETARYEAHAPYDVTVSGADHPGIIHEISQFMADKGINIEAMETNVTDAPLTGAPLFTMQAIVYAPAQVPLHDLQLALEAIGDEHAVDTDVKRHSPED